MKWLAALLLMMAFAPKASAQTAPCPPEAAPGDTARPMIRLEASARALFVHTNTVRYRLRRAAELCGHAPTDARGAFTIQLALVLGRLNGQPGGRPAGLSGGQPAMQ